jgi:2,4-dienoyl-CoA reductase-like NADH-dependent reductase (Old Yellow Enzyme family)
MRALTQSRKDRWGGSLENRIRLHHETYKDIRKKAGEDYPVMIKMGVQDGFNDALIIDEGKLAARLLSEWGFDVIEVSQGLRGKWFEETEMRTKINSVEKEGYFRPWAREVKKEVKTPTVMQGGLRTFELVEEIIKNKEADFIGLCRPLLREPNLVNDWEKGDTRTSRCISCNRCVMEILKGNALGCYLDNKEIK